MRMRLLSGVAGLCLFLAALPTQAADEKPAAPGVFVRMKSIEGQLADARYLAELANKGDDFKQYEGLYKQLLKDEKNKNNLEGLDVTKPIGAYGNIGPNGVDSKFVILVPIYDEKTALEFLKTKEVPVEKEKDGSYKIDVPNSPLGAAYVRFANKYAYITMGDANKDMIDPKNLLDPTKVLPANQTSMLSLTLDVDKVPDELKKVAIGQSANQIAGLKDMKLPDETDAQHQLRLAMLDEMADWTKMVLNDGGELTVSLDVDQKKGDLSMSVSLAGKKDSKLAKTFTDLGMARSVGAGLVGKDSAMNMLMHVSLPDRIKKALDPVIDESFKKALDEEKDKDKKALAEKAFKVIAPTLKSGELDMGMNIRGPSATGKYSMVAAMKIKDGTAIEKTIKDLIKTLPEKEQKAIKLDVEKAGTVNIHRVEGNDLDQKTKDMFGDGPGFFALRDDAIMLAIGDGALEALKDALNGKAAPSKTMQFEMSMSRLAKLAENDPNAKGAEEAAKKAFAKDKDADKITIALEGGPALKLKFNMKAQLVTFFAYIAEKQGKID